MTTNRGRPRSFDREVALHKALVVFWRHGYEGSSMAALTQAMGLNPPSVYAAFGDKRELFKAVVNHYQESNRGIMAETLGGAATAREAVERLLHRRADDYTDPSHPPGCLVISAAVNYSPASADVAEELCTHRSASQRALVERIAVDHPDEAETLGRYFGAVIQGMSTQARDGATRAQLHEIADTALLAWPESL